MSAPYPFPYKSVACTFLLLWAFVFLSADLFAGFIPLTLGIKEGLGSRQVFQINKDSAGFVWVYTHVGIDRYDGNESSITSWTEWLIPGTISSLPLP